jgi:hypothetical protein
MMKEESIQNIVYNRSHASLIVRKLMNFLYMIAVLEQEKGI